MWIAFAFSVAVWIVPLKAVEALGLFGTAFGVAVTLGAVALAARIYLRQHDHAEQSGRDTQTKLGALEAKVDGLLEGAVQVPLDRDEELAAEDEVEDDEADDVAVDLGTQVWVGEQSGRSLESEDVPLSVLANLVWGWRRDSSMLKNEGRWSVRNLRGAWRPDSRAKDGRGNTPWYLTFESTGGERRVWRVYRGGKNQPRPTVRDVTSEVGA